MIAPGALTPLAHGRKQNVEKGYRTHLPYSPGFKPAAYSLFLCIEADPYRFERFINPSSKSVLSFAAFTNSGERGSTEGITNVVLVILLPKRRSKICCTNTRTYRLVHRPYGRPPVTSQRLVNTKVRRCSCTSLHLRLPPYAAHYRCLRTFSHVPNFSRFSIESNSKLRASRIRNDESHDFH